MHEPFFDECMRLETSNYHLIHFNKKDGAPRGAHAAQALALRERLRCANETLTLVTLDHFRHSRHFF